MFVKRQASKEEESAFFALPTKKVKPLVKQDETVSTRPCQGNDNDKHDSSGQSLGISVSPSNSHRSNILLLGHNGAPIQSNASKGSLQKQLCVPNSSGILSPILPSNVCSLGVTGAIQHPDAVEVVKTNSAIEPKQPLGFQPLGFQPSSFVYDTERDEAFDAIDLWIRKPALHEKPLLLVGPIGNGSTRLLTHYAKGCLEWYEEEDLESFLEPHGLKGLKPIGVFESLDTLEAEDKCLIKRMCCKLPVKEQKKIGQNKTLANAIAKSTTTELKRQRRIIVCTTSILEEPGASWASWCQVVKLKAPSVKFTVQILSNMCSNLAVSQDVLRSIANTTRCNLSAAVCNLEWTLLHLRQQQCKGADDKHVEYNKHDKHVARDARVAQDIKVVRQLEHVAQTQTIDLSISTKQSVYNLCTKKRQPCFAASEDLLFLSSLYHATIPTLCTSKAQIQLCSKVFESLSTFDILCETRSFTNEYLWWFLEQLAQQGPSIDSNVKYCMQWPKSVKRTLHNTNWEYTFKLPVKSN